MSAKRVFLIFLLLFSASIVRCEPEQTSENRHVETELSLANSDELYFIVDIGDKRIDLKARGIMLRTWKIERVLLWGDPVPSNPVSLMKKTTLFPPKREEIKPDETGEESTYELEALELVDMPSSYRLGLERNIAIYIRPKSTGWTSSLKKIGPVIRWYFYHPAKTIWTKANKKPFTVFDIILENKEESKSFYWALSQNSPFIILPPNNTMP